LDTEKRAVWKRLAEEGDAGRDRKGVRRERGGAGGHQRIAVLEALLQRQRVRYA
jgi:hypothetical protein